MRQREEASNLGEWEEKGARTHTGDPGEGAGLGGRCWMRF